MTNDSTLDITNCEDALKLVSIKDEDKFCAVTIHFSQCRYDGVIDIDNFILDFRCIVHIISLFDVITSLRDERLKEYLLHDQRTRWCSGGHRSRSSRTLADGS